MARSGALKRERPMKQSKPARRKKEFARCYGSAERIAFVKARGCVVRILCQGPIDVAHVGNGGAGRKANASSTVGLCRRHHEQSHAIGVRSFEQAHGLDLAALAAETHQRWLAHIGESQI